MTEEENTAMEEQHRFPMVEEPPETERAEDDPGEVPTSFATKGFGRSGRDADKL